MEKRINYGKLLKRAIDRKGLTKSRIATQLGISRPTLEVRMVDGEFKESQIFLIKILIK